MTLHERLREKLAQARAAHEDDSLTDHGALGHVLDVLDELLGRQWPEGPPVGTPAEPPQTA